MRGNRHDLLESGSSTVHATNAENFVSSLEVLDRFPDRIDNTGYVTAKHSGPGLHGSSKITIFPIDWVQGYRFSADAYLVGAGSGVRDGDFREGASLLVELVLQ